MQKAVVAEKSQKPEKAEKTLASSISAAKMSVLSVPIKNAPGSPLVINAFSAKAREAMRAAQEAGSAGKNKRQRAPKDFDAVYQNARHISREGWDGAAAATFRNAMIDSCRLVGFKMTVGKRSDRQAWIEVVWHRWMGTAGLAAIGCVGLERSRTMSMRDEIKQLSTEYEARGATLTADDVVRSAQDADKYPDLHDHLWGVSETILAHEARLARAHKLIISIRVVQEEGVESRLYIHTPGIAGYQPLKKVLATPDLAVARLQQLSADVGRARQRLREFRMLLPGEVADAIDASLEASERAIVGAAERRQASTGAAA